MGCGLGSNLRIQALGLCSLTLLACGGGSGQTTQTGDATGQPATAALPASAGGASTTSGAKATAASGAGSGAAAQATATAGTSPVATTTSVPGSTAMAAAAGTGAGPSGDVAKNHTGARGAGGAAGGGAGAAAGSGAAGTPAEEACATVIPPSTDCKAKLAPGDHRMCTVGTREYIVHAGKTMSQCKPVGLVIDAHGASETAPEQFGSEEFCAGGGTCWQRIGSGWAGADR